MPLSHDCKFYHLPRLSLLALPKHYWNMKKHVLWLWHSFIHAFIHSSDVITECWLWARLLYFQSSQTNEGWALCTEAAAHGGLWRGDGAHGVLQKHGGGTAVHPDWVWGQGKVYQARPLGMGLWRMSGTCRMEKWQKSTPNTGSSIVLEFKKWQSSMSNIKNKTFEVKWSIQEGCEGNLKTTLANVKAQSHWMGLLFSWIIRYHIEKMFVSPKFLYKRSEILIKMPTESFFRGIAKWYSYSFFKMKYVEFWKRSVIKGD